METQSEDLRPMRKVDGLLGRIKENRIDAESRDKTIDGAFQEFAKLSPREKKAILKRHGHTLVLYFIREKIPKGLHSLAYALDRHYEFSIEEKSTNLTALCNLYFQQNDSKIKGAILDMWFAIAKSDFEGCFRDSIASTTEVGTLGNLKKMYAIVMGKFYS